MPFARAPDGVKLYYGECGECRSWAPLEDAREVKAVPDHLAIERARIVGHSMGAYTTLHAAATKYAGFPMRRACGWSIAIR